MLLQRQTEGHVGTEKCRKGKKTESGFDSPARLQTHVPAGETLRRRRSV